MSDKFTKIDAKLTPKIRNLDEDNHPILKHERRFNILMKNQLKSKQIYNQFLEDLSNYNLKMSSGPCKGAIDSLIKRDLIFIGRNSSKNSNDIVGRIILSNNKLAGIAIDIVQGKIDTITGMTSEIDTCYYFIYFEFIRSVVIINQKEIFRNDKINKLAKQYLYMFLLRFLGTELNLTEKQKIFLEALIDYFYHRFMLLQDHLLAKEIILKDYKDISLKREIDHHLNLVSKYTIMRDIFKAMIDFNIIKIAPTVLVLKLLSKFKKFIFYALTTSIDYLIALAIISNYPSDFWNKAAVTGNVSILLENNLKEFYPKIKYDTSYFK